jgi:hypothetical protein
MNVASRWGNISCAGKNAGTNKNNMMKKQFRMLYEYQFTTYWMYFCGLLHKWEEQEWFIKILPVPGHNPGCRIEDENSGRGFKMEILPGRKVWYMYLMMVNL